MNKIILKNPTFLETLLLISRNEIFYIIFLWFDRSEIKRLLKNRVFCPIFYSRIYSRIFLSLNHKIRKLMSQKERTYQTFIATLILLRTFCLALLNSHLQNWNSIAGNYSFVNKLKSIHSVSPEICVFIMSPALFTLRINLMAQWYSILFLWIISLLMQAAR